jgi:hypothetical protein
MNELPVDTHACQQSNKISALSATAVVSRRATGRPTIDIESHRGEGITGDLMTKAW